MPIFMQNNIQKFANFVFFQTETGKVNIDVLFAKNTLWLSQKLMSVLFECSTDNISLHLKNIFQEKELIKKATTEDFSLVAKEGNREVSRKLKYYNLSAIIAVGFRVNSQEKITKLQAQIKANSEYDKFRVLQDQNYISDFDKTIKQIKVEK
jgi:hypothetical protein